MILKQLYRLTVDPHGFDQFLDMWDTHITSRAEHLPASTKWPRDGEAIASDVMAETELREHFEIVAQIMRTQGRGTDDLSGLRHRTTNRASVLLAKSGTLVWMNRAAHSDIGGDAPGTLAEMPFSAEDRAKVENWLSLLDGEMQGQAPFEVLRLEGETPRLLSLRAVQGDDGESLALLSDVVAEWPAALDRYLNSRGLSDTEQDVTRLFFDGLDTAAIADLRERSPATVRTQVKSVMAKMGVHSQVELARQLVSLSNVAHAHHRGHGATQQDRKLFQLGDRELLVYFSGPATGRPMIFLHGMMEHPVFTPRVQAELHARGIRIIAPVRPNFGDGPSDLGHPGEVKEHFVQDVAALIKRLELNGLPIVGHLAGSVYSYDIAMAAGAAVSAVVSLAGGAPIKSRAQLDLMPRRPRLMAYTARYTPAFLPFVIRAGVRELDYGGARQMMRTIHEQSPPDIKALKDSDVFVKLHDGYKFSVSQGHRAFEVDAYHVVRDWTDSACKVSVPIRFIHGTEDGINRFNMVEAFCGEVPGAKMLPVKGGGQLIMSSHTIETLDLLESVMAEVG